MRSAKAQTKQLANLLFCAAKPKPYAVFILINPNPSSPTTLTSLQSNQTLTTTMNSIDEADVGIFCFISNLPGFCGILKQRYADFIVNEVDNDGNVVHLTCLDAPPEVVQDDDAKVPKIEAMTANCASQINALKSLVSESDAQLLEDFINQISPGNEDMISHITLSPDSDKSHRTVIHNFFKNNLKFLVTDTVDGPDASTKCVRVRVNGGGHNERNRGSKKRKERGGKPFDSRGSSNWPEHVGKFLRFHLYKENKDTQEALGIIGRMLGVQPRSFGFAGTKDKRAVSAQRVTVFKQQASRLAALNGRLIGIKVGDFCYVKEGLVLGQLLGNRFTVTLRGVIADSDETIKASADSLGNCGFINYFGLQRFGSSSVPTHLIGATLLRGEWKMAVNMILDPKEGERHMINDAREYYKKSNDIEGTLRQLPRHLVAERAILQGLKKCTGNYLQALSAIPRTLRMMFVHSYQSFLWNHAASARVQKYGTNQVVPGDLVYSKADDAETDKGGLSSECDNEHCDDSDEYIQLDEISEADLHEKTNTAVKALTSEDICSGNYSIYDILLPMPGSRVIYPANDVSQIYHDLAKKDGINLCESTHRVKEFSITSVTGSYRLVFQKPKDFEWELLTYTDGNVPLAETDMDKISTAKPSSTKEHTLPRENQGIKEVEIGGQLEDENQCNSSSQEVQRALKLSFTLAASCYATMAIRELLKTSTSVAFHKALNQ